VNHLNIIIITGLSGSGKTTAMAALEDNGYYCVDNLPVELLPKFLELPIEERNSELAGLGFVMDLREKSFVSKYESILGDLRQRGYQYEILFLEADDRTLLHRYKATRRQHPLAKGQGIAAAIQAEKELLKPLRTACDRIIDTSAFNVHELKAHIADIAAKTKKYGAMQINVLSFGFKYGIPQDADLIIDVRFLPNPYFHPRLKPLDGANRKIRDFVLGKKTTRDFLDRYLDLLDFLIPHYEREGKAHLTIAVGCTGGRHRSVVIASEVSDHIAESERQVTILHRDIGQG
jgi:UPF0042 nucleotide-binding protein